MSVQKSHGSKLFLLARDLFRWTPIWLGWTPPRVEKSEKSWLKVGPAGSRPVSVDTHLAGTAPGLRPRPTAKKKDCVIGPSRFYRCPPDFTDALPIFYRLPPDFHVRPPAFYVSPTFLTTHFYPLLPKSVPFLSTL